MIWVKRIKTAGPSTPVEITGINDVPQAGDRFVIFKDEKQARRIGEARHEASVIQQRQESKNVSLDNLFEQMKQGEMKDLNVIIKGDVQGSVEALAASLMKIDVEGVNVRIIHTAVGAINESDVTLANASNGIIVDLTYVLMQVRNVQQKLKMLICVFIESSIML